MPDETVAQPAPNPPDPNATVARSPGDTGAPVTTPGFEPITVTQAGGGGDPNPVPAPPAVALFALGALALGVRRKRA